jgi:16S rRNA (cytosine1402-N4)-methyltransferase
MVDEVVAALLPVPPGVLVDATVGGGGHAGALLAAHPGLVLVGLDRDDTALAAAAESLAPYQDRVTLRQVRFDALTETMEDLGHANATAVLFDLGVSSPQLDQGDRGFSYRNEGPIDMRMDRTQPWSAADVVNGYDEAELARIIRRYGDERFAGRIARAIVSARPIETTAELAGIVSAAIPAAARRTGGHPAKRTFQAIRIEVNSELDVLPGALDQAIESTAPRGRIAVLSYHSGEDRIVKERFRAAEGGDCTCPPGLPCVCGAIQLVRRVRVPRTPTADQSEANPRARSARLRVVEKVGKS